MKACVTVDYLTVLLFINKHCMGVHNKNGSWSSSFLVGQCHRYLVSRFLSCRFYFLFSVSSYLILFRLAEGARTAFFPPLYLKSFLPYHIAIKLRLKIYPGKRSVSLYYLETLVCKMKHFFKHSFAGPLYALSMSRFWKYIHVLVSANIITVYMFSNI